jgi:hypothetical protein
MRPALHFIGFKRDKARLAIATRYFGAPDFIHFYFDYRALGDIAPGDYVVFATGDEHSIPTPYAFNDSEEQ